MLFGYDGNLILEFHRARIEGNGASEPMPSEQVFDNDPNPWPGIEKAPYWLTSEGVREREAKDGYDSIETWRSTKREWKQGVPGNQGAWLQFRWAVTV